MLTVINGPMFSGKTSRLISICSSNVIAGKSVIVFKPANDDRYSQTSIVAHTFDKFAAVSVPIEDPHQSIEIWSKMAEASHIDMICFDEAQFFDKAKLIDTVGIFCKYVSEVVCAGLSQDSDGKPFGGMPELLAVADTIINLKSVCNKCKRVEHATRTFRKASESKQVVIGGADKYEAHCFDCWKTWSKK